VRRLEDYAVVGDLQSAALVGADGAIDWLCLPRFDSDACFAALLGDERHGRWTMAPADHPRPAGRRYRPGTLVLETDLEGDGGAVRLVDCMPPRDEVPDLVRVVEGVRGAVRMRSRLAPRFGYGATLPWIHTWGRWATAGAGPDTLVLTAPVELRREGADLVADFTVAAGERVAFHLGWHRSYERTPAPSDPLRALAGTEAFWSEWSSRCAVRGPWSGAMIRSLITLKALTYAPSGGIVAAATTSLPECPGGTRNWDYRFCWLRDATFVLFALMDAGYASEARAWRNWLVRAVAGDPRQIQVLYGVGGERRLEELELGWLPGYEGSAPVRIGNSAARQQQLDVLGEVMDSLHQSRRLLDPDERVWALQRGLLEFLEARWERPDHGIWEVRGPRLHFTHSKVMAWVAVDRAVRDVERFGLEGPVERWRSLRRAIHDDVCRHAWDPGKNSLTQAYGSPALDAALLLVPLVGFLPICDARVRGTVAAIERELLEDGLVRRYDTATAVDGLPAGEGLFLACSFWLADVWALQGRRDEAVALFERLLSLANDVGLLSEEYDPSARRLVGNFPQAFSHVALLNTARNLTEAGGPTLRRLAGCAPGQERPPPAAPGGR